MTANTFFWGSSSPERLCKDVEFYSRRCFFMDVLRATGGVEVNSLMLWQGKFMPTFWTLSESTLHGGRAGGTGKGSAICYVKGETAFWAAQHMLRFRTHLLPLSLDQPSNEVLKTFSRCQPNYWSGEAVDFGNN